MAVFTFTGNGKWITNSAISGSALEFTTGELIALVVSGVVIGLVVAVVALLIANTRHVGGGTTEMTRRQLLCTGFVATVIPATVWVSIPMLMQTEEINPKRPSCIIQGNDAWVIIFGGTVEGCPQYGSGIYLFLFLAATAAFIWYIAGNGGVDFITPLSEVTGADVGYAFLMFVCVGLLLIVAAIFLLVWLVATAMFWAFSAVALYGVASSRNK